MPFSQEAATNGNPTVHSGQKLNSPDDSPAHGYFPGFLFLKQRLRELLRVEGLQIIRLLTETDEFDGQA